VSAVPITFTYEVSQARSHSFAVSCLMFGGTTNSGLVADAVDHDRNQITENAADEHAHEELNRC
jgi:hypothetical protein